jgi:hypothetical protein
MEGVMKETEIWKITNKVVNMTGLNEFDARMLVCRCFVTRGEEFLRKYCRESGIYSEKVILKFIKYWTNNNLWLASLDEGEGLYTI